MKIVFRETIVDRIFKASAEAAVAGKEIEHIELTEAEYGRLVKETRHLRFYNHTGGHIEMIAGHKIVVAK